MAKCQRLQRSLANPLNRSEAGLGIVAGNERRALCPVPMAPRHRGEAAKWTGDKVVKLPAHFAELRFLYEYF